MNWHVFAFVVVLAVAGPPIAHELGASYGDRLRESRPATPHGALPTVHQKVLLHFWRPNCPMSVKTQARVRALQRHGCTIRSYNTLNDKRKSREYGIHATPTFILIEGGEEKWRRAGGYDARAIRRMCE